MRDKTKRQVHLQDKDARAVLEFTQKVREAIGESLIAIKLFGSKATGHADPGSDIDLLIEVRENDLKLEDQVLDIAFDVNLAHDVYISPRVIPLAILNDPVWKSTPFLQNIEKEGVLL